MTWANFYLVCFLVGFILSLLSIVAGSVHVHLPHLDLHHGMPHVHVAHAHGGGQSGVSVVNFGTIAAFLAWFGGTGGIGLSAAPKLVIDAVGRRSEVHRGGGTRWWRRQGSVVASREDFLWRMEREGWLLVIGRPKRRGGAGPHGSSFSPGPGRRGAG